MVQSKKQKFRKSKLKNQKKKKIEKTVKFR